MRYRLSELNCTSPYFLAMKCVLNDERAIYCSSELTSGLRLYNELLKRDLKADWELKRQVGDAWYKKNIVKVNSDAANEFAASVRRKQTDGTLVITPAPLEVPGWGQPEYLAFWEELIRTRVKEVRFNKNWQFSNGCTLEFWAAADQGIPTFDLDGNPLGLGAAMASIQAAVEHLDKDGFDTAKLRDNLLLMRSLGAPPPTNGANHHVNPS